MPLSDPVPVPVPVRELRLPRGMMLRRGSRSSRTPAIGVPPKAEPGDITITALGRALGVPSSTLRYYESIGLLIPTQRTRSGYRLYGPRAIERGRFILLSQEAGLTLDDIRAVLEPRGSSAGCSVVRRILMKRLDDVRMKIAALRRFEHALLEGITCRPKHVSDLCRRLCAAAGPACDNEC